MTTQDREGWRKIRKTGYGVWAKILVFLTSLTRTKHGLQCHFQGRAMDSGKIPHAQIPDMEVKVVQDGYELWMSCLSRGIAVLHAITDPVGIKQSSLVEPDLRLSSYPNPIANRTTLSFSLVNSGPISITIYDINGKVVWSQENVRIHPDYCAIGDRIV